jgi:hypothetical protein
VWQLPLVLQLVLLLAALLLLLPEVCWPVSCSRPTCC